LVLSKLNNFRAVILNAITNCFNKRKREQMKYFKTVAAIAIIITFFVACDNFFEFSVYGANVQEAHKNTTSKNLQLIEEMQVASSDFKFAVVTDSHIFYTNFNTVLDDINKNEDISFVIFGGDLAEQGLLKEYELFYGLMEHLQKPYLTVIGNHDYSSNGGEIYMKMFGDYNYSFEFNENKFIFFDDIVWESNKNPDFDWLSSELSSNNLFKNVFVIAHIPPFGDQLDPEMEQRYQSLMQANNVPLSIHGHTHSFLYENFYEDAVNYLTVPAPNKAPSYVIVSVQNESFEIELIKL
jgi:Icc-related predicted phosphoesterase